jgi:superfamily II DNA or RNA helicase
LSIADKCIVKKFCGTGKSLLMRKCKSVQNKNLIVYVFPSLCLIDQFYDQYLFDIPEKLKISSEKESTTDPELIISFLKKEENKIICITYQSFKTLIDNLGVIIIDVCVFDEAHHAVGETYQKLIFEDNNSRKQIFFTATPKNSNGITMYDRHHPENNMCGKLVYDYSYLTGICDGYLNPFEVRIDMYTENTNTSVYETIARAVLASGNNRVLTFHSDVNTDRDTSVLNFVNENKFIDIFNKVKKKEFPKKEFPKIKKYKTCKMIAFTSSMGIEERKTILKNFDESPEDKVYIISSCETIGEGIDTKNANMCVFVDPKSSYIKIIQNIGRIVRKIYGFDKPNSTILIPCWIDRTKYLECEGDREKCDEVIRSEMNKDGDFNGILNVVSALKQEDEDLYDICLHYPDKFSPSEIRGNLETQGYTVQEPVGDLSETIEYLLDTEIELEEDEDEEEMIIRIAEDNNVCIEIHTDSLEEPIQTYNKDCEEVIRIFKSEDEEECIYQPIIKKCGEKRNKDRISSPDRNKRLNLKVNSNPDIQVLWKITAGDITKEISSCIIDCEVIDRWDKNFKNLKKFIDDNKKVPIQKSKNIEEKSLGSWLSKQKLNYKKKEMIEERYNLWTKFLEQYKKYIKSFDEKWMEHFENLKYFIDDNKKRPSDISKNQEEQSLGSWLSDQNTSYKKKELVEERYNLWTKFLEKYKKYFKSLDDIWNEKFENLKKFINDNKRAPIQEPKNLKEKTYKQEKLLGSWLSNQQQYYKNKKKSMNNQIYYNLWTSFLEEYKEYFKSFDEKWMEHFENLKHFIDDNKKTPNSNSKNKEENFLGRWLCGENTSYKKKELVEERYNLWTDFLEKYKKYVKDLDEKWMEHFENLKHFMDENKKKPIKNSENEEERHMEQWLSQQKKFYKNKTLGMKCVIRYNLFTKFLEQYIDSSSKKKSMKLNTSTSSSSSTEERRKRNKSELSEQHQKYKTMTSQNLHKEFNENPELWEKYHEISEENEKLFPENEIPRNRIMTELDKIKTKRSKSVVDMGCGKAHISKHFKKDKRFTFTNLDHYSSDDTIVSCDISHTGLEDDSTEICILSLAMWGSNCREYIEEAYRILETNGTLYIIEPTKRWSEKDEHNNIINEPGMKLKQLLQENNFRIDEQNIEKFSLFVCRKV